MHSITMMDVIYLLGLPYPPAGRTHYYVPCPYCDADGKDKHLNINMEKNVFRCPKCGEYGGYFDLYSLFTGVSRENVREEIYSRLGIDDNEGAASSAKERKPRQKPEHKVELIAQSPLASIEERDRTYRALLNMLPLASDHRSDLLRRGLSEEIINTNCYRTTPMVGLNTIPNLLNRNGYTLAGIPGFYRNEKNGEWMLASWYRGMYIPVRDLQGRIKGMQIRKDKVKKRKYRWLSSAELLDGCKADCSPHIVGEPTKTIYLTEGPLKADVFHHLTKRTIIGIAGVNTLNELAELLQEVRQLGMADMKIAFDMDFLKAKGVQNGYANIRALLEKEGIAYKICLWDPRYNGIDDYVLACKMQKYKDGRGVGHAFFY